MSFQLRRLRVSGPEREPAEVDFSNGLNVISGPSDTGKSYLVEAIDFMLGGGSAPRPIPESRGYDRVSLSLEVGDGHVFEFTRSLQGGEFEVHPAVPQRMASDRDPDIAVEDEVVEDTGVTTRLSSRLSSSANISSFLLGLVGLGGKFVRSNAYNQTQRLSFRNLAHLVVVDEESIIKKRSPLHSTVSSARPVENSVLKLLLTGTDDSSLIPLKKPEIAKAELGAQDALLGDLIEEYEEDLRSRAEHVADLPAQLERLEASIRESEEAVERQRLGFEEQESTRRTAWERRDAVQQRESEVKALLERFTLLDQHYTSDLRRLEAIAEAGFFFVALAAGTCPLCGAPAGDHAHDAAPHDADIGGLRASCEREIAKISKLQEELAKAVADLRAEQNSLAREVQDLTKTYRSANALVRETLAPALSEARAQHAKLVETRSDLRQSLSLAERIEMLKQRQQEVAGTVVSRSTGDRPLLPAESLQHFNRAFETLLEAWHFPHEKPVMFDPSIQDFVLGSRRRGEQGKGLRALTHAAFSIGLLDACRTLNRPHVGFVLLDSPLVTFREAEPEDDSLGEPEKAEVKQCFYRDLASRMKADQVIVVENEDPEDGLRPGIVCHLFTKRDGDGRYGFFPRTSE